MINKNLSRRNLLGLTGDTGAWLRAAMGALCNFGVPPEKYWPYDIAKYDEEPPAFVYALGQAYQAGVAADNVQPERFGRFGSPFVEPTIAGRPTDQ